MPPPSYDGPNELTPTRIWNFNGNRRAATEFDASSVEGAESSAKRNRGELERWSDHADFSASKLRASGAA